MRRQIAAANWKMNTTLSEATQLLTAFKELELDIKENQAVCIAVPFPYLLIAKEILGTKAQFSIAAQNCYQQDFGAFTGEVSAAMLASCGISHVILGHSERRAYFKETNEMISQKVDAALLHGLLPVFCCGESLEIREKQEQNEYVSQQIQESLFHLDAAAFRNVVIAYEPIWAIGTGKTATATQAQEMHAHIRREVSEQYGSAIAENTSVLYGGSVKGNNALELFSQPDVDGGLVGGASLKAAEFASIIKSLK